MYTVVFDALAKPFVYLAELNESTRCRLNTCLKDESISMRAGN
ncbi:hypothetical protein [Candidatus Hartigia pinicola]